MDPINAPAKDNLGKHSDPKFFMRLSCPGNGSGVKYLCGKCGGIIELKCQGICTEETYECDRQLSTVIHPCLESNLGIQLSCKGCLPHLKLQKA